MVSKDEWRSFVFCSLLNILHLSHSRFLHHLIDIYVYVSSSFICNNMYSHLFYYYYCILKRNGMSSAKIRLIWLRIQTSVSVFLTLL